MKNDLEAFLRNPRSGQTELKIYSEDLMSNRVALNLAECIAGNSTLEELYLSLYIDSDQEVEIKKRGSETELDAYHALHN